MQEKKPLKTKGLTAILIAFLIIATLFFIYEVTLIGNPFQDPITPYYLWGTLVIMSWGFAFRYIKAKRGDK